METPKNVALAYLDAVSRKDFDTVASLLAPNLAFDGPAMQTRSAEPYLAALHRIGAVLLRNEVKKVFADGAEVCIVYDFVTDTKAGAVPIVEWLRIEEGRIASIVLFFDRLLWQPAAEEVARRTRTEGRAAPAA
jgi:ketosteroid isomerase-like protein